jgi:TetR/AcrR family transcriptional repressor of nem operon
MLIGAVTLARAVRGDPLSDEILEAAREHLGLGSE